MVSNPVLTICGIVIFITGIIVIDCIVSIARDGLKDRDK